MAEEEPRDINKIIAVTEAERGRKVGRSAVKRVMKKKHTWKRIRKSLKGKRDDEKFEKAKEKIGEWERRREEDESDVCHFDETGFLRYLAYLAPGSRKVGISKFPPPSDSISMCPHS